MADYPNLPARYSKGTLKLRKPLRLPDGMEVRVTVKVGQPAARSRRTTRRRYWFPNRALPSHTLEAISGLASIGGDALADSEAMYDSD